MANIFMYHPDPDVLKLMSGIIMSYFDSVKHTYRIFGSWNMNESMLFLKDKYSWVDIAVIDHSSLENAFRLSGYIRRANSRAFIVHIGDTDTLIKSLIYRPSAFIDDPADKNKLTETVSGLDMICRKTEAERFLIFRFEGEPMRIAYRNIEYFESRAKKVMIHMDNRTVNYCFTAKLDDLQEQVPQFFLRCHQSYLVNMKCISRMDVLNRTFLMHSEEVVLISKRMMSEARLKYEAFIKN